MQEYNRKCNKLTVYLDRQLAIQKTTHLDKMRESTDKVPLSTRQGHSSDTKQIIPALLGTEDLSLPSLQAPATCPDIILFDYITRIKVNVK